MVESPKECSVIFVDLAGFTALTETHGDEQAADLVERFVAMARHALGPGDRLVKSIGDAVMLASPAPSAALDSLTRLLAECYATASFPIPRAGLHHGPIVERDSDVFGATVNLAARIAGQASGGQVLGTLPIATAARGNDTPVTGVGLVHLRNVAEPVELFEIHLSDTKPFTYTVDPVCRMRVEPAHAAGWLRHGGTEWWFCSLTCVAAFAKAPETHVRMNA